MGICQIFTVVAAIPLGANRAALEFRGSVNEHQPTQACEAAELPNE